MESITTILGDDLLEEVLLRLTSPVTLIRASAVCKPWRRLLTDPSFLRGFHPSLRLGTFVTTLYSTPLFFVPPPQPDPELAAVINRIDFSLPRFEQDSWGVESSLDNVLLLINRPRDRGILPRAQQLAAFDPFSRRHALFGPPPLSFLKTDLKTDESGRYIEGGYPLYDAYYLIGTQNGTSQWFRVVCIIQSGSGLRAAVFCSDTEDWCFYPWSQMLFPVPDKRGKREIRYKGMQGNGSLYFHLKHGLLLLVLDKRTMQFSFMDTPPRAAEDGQFMVGETEDGELCGVVVRNGSMLIVWIRSKEEEDGGERWVLHKEVMLLEQFYRIIPGGGKLQIFRITIVRMGYVYLVACDHSFSSQWSSGLISLRLKTMQLEKEEIGGGIRLNPCTITWPPAFHG